jgi:D-alanyl-lipoteichoic acid acyltransferase DltB (MBOAT superfamily)
MLFNTINFAIFLPIVFILYWFVTNKNLKVQNILLLLSSYFFYASWDWRFLFLLVFSTVLDYYTGIKISEEKNTRKRNFWFTLSLTINLGFLGVFKYFNFFSESLAQALSQVGLTVEPLTLNVILPIGISFYTFHGLSYVIDIYKNRINAEKNFIDYSLFVSFFPLLVAGPIERATHLLPQIKQKRVFEYDKAVDGLRQILWGLFKKIVIADQSAIIANNIFDSYLINTGSTNLLGGLFFTFQIYGDFSGYSDIAMGVAKLFGIDLLRNFAFPYFSRDIAEFWRRWHISLSSWFRDYLYIPLGGSKGGMWMKIRNTLIIFIVSGFWHGANWTYIVWGFLNALYIMPSIIFKSNRNNLDIVAKGKYLPNFRELSAMLLTFFLTIMAWIVFRAENISKGFTMIASIFSASLFSIPNYNFSRQVKLTTIFILIFIVIEWFGRENQYAIAKNGKQFNRLVRWLFYFLIILSIIYFTGKANQEFIYFQF